MSTPRTFDKVLVANRGEIARRVFRTLREMGLTSVAIHSDADERAAHVADADEAVRIGGAASAESYLDIERVLAAARRVGADAIHPGYGFLSENEAFARACAQAGVVFIGPSPEVIARMGSKIEAKLIAQEAGMPVIPGFSAVDLDAAEIARRADEVGYPLLVKASGGGGGRGMRVVRDAGGLEAALEAAEREATAAFGDGRLLIERYLEAPRHIEVQVFGDSHGNVVHCFERECSIQRRHQKVIEEAPSPAVDDALRTRMTDAALALARSIGYEGAGTVELILDSRGDFYFLEVNTRLQVEHPVTELITGLDLVRMQVEVAQGLPLSVTQDAITARGHAIEARLYAEDAARDFLPATGTVAMWSVPSLPGLRVDSGVEAGSEVPVHYDPMLAKVVAHGADREEARRRIVQGLSQLAVGGVTTNRDFLRAALGHAAFAQGALHTGFIDAHLPPEARVPAADAALRADHVIAALVADIDARGSAPGPLPGGLPGGFRNNPSQRKRATYLLGDEQVSVSYVVARGGGLGVRVESEGTVRDCEVARIADGRAVQDALPLEIDGVRRRFLVVRHAGGVSVHGGGACSELSRAPRFPTSTAGEVEGACVAPMTGVIRKVCVAVGDAVEKGSLLIMLEAMKMEHELRAHGCGTVTAVRVEPGQMVDPDEVLVVVEASGEGSGEGADDGEQ